MVETARVGSRAARRRRDNELERGAVLIEAAIVMPLILLIVFGILEFGLAFRNTLSVSESTRAGARVAVAQPRVDGYEANAAAAVSGSLATSGIPADQIEELVIYKADPETGRTHLNQDPKDCTVSCWRFTWNEGSSEFQPVGGYSWPAASQSACGAIDKTDYLGVYVRARYDFITGILPGSLTITEHSVMRLEPLPLSDTCEPA